MIESKINVLKMANAHSVHKLYKSVIEDVITNVREAFLDEGVDEQVLQELKQIWEHKLLATRAVEICPQPVQNATTCRQRQQQRGNAPSTSASSQLQAQLHLQALAEARQQGASSAAVGGVIQQHGIQTFPVTGADAAISSSAAAAANLALRQQQGMLQLPSQLGSLPPGVTLAHSAQGGMQTFPSYSLSQAQAGVLQGGVIQGGVIQGGVIQGGVMQAGYQTILPTGETVILQPATQAQQLQHQQQATEQLPQQLVQSGDGVIRSRVLQVDGANDSSDDEDDDDDENDDDNEDNADDSNDVQEEPLNSDDDVSDEDPSELFETDNVVVCQYDKINRNRNRWKFHLKNGIMNLKGRDYVFFKANGEAEW